jgi:predicted RNase H-like nuclease (RuvC/YqgF family)
MARQPMDIRKRIERQEKKILQLTDELEQAKEEYEKLQMELKEQEKAELFEAYSKSKRSFDCPAAH